MSFLFLLFVLGVPRAEALISVSTWACLGIDGAPISVGSSLASSCCSNGVLVSNPPDICRVGVTSVGATAAAGISFHLEVAKKTLGISQSLSGSVNNYGSPTPTPEPITSSEVASIGAVTAAEGSGSEFTGRKDLKLGAMGASKEAGSGSDTGTLGGSGGEGGLGVGTSSLSKSDKKDGSNSETSPNGAGTYAKNGEGSAQDSPEGAGFDFSGALDGLGAGSGAPSAENSNPEIKFGEKDADGNPIDPHALTGSPNDAPDYLKRIDQSANIFKIVTARYTKESLRKHVGAE